MCCTTSKGYVSALMSGGDGEGARPADCDCWVVSCSLISYAPLSKRNHLVKHLQDRPGELGRTVCEVEINVHRVDVEAPLAVHFGGVVHGDDELILANLDRPAFEIAYGQRADGGRHVRVEQLINPDQFVPHLEADGTHLVTVVLIEGSPAHDA